MGVSVYECMGVWLYECMGVWVYGCMSGLVYGYMQLAVLKKGLEVHGQRISAALKGMQQNLEEKLEMMVFEVFPERRKRVRTVLWL